MIALKLYQKLDQDFELDKLTDDWKEMDFNEYITENFKKRYMGLVADNSEEINKVYTAVFPDEKILGKILESGEKDILLFIHHPMIWDVSISPVFKSIPKEYLKKMRENKISVYNLHAPLDKNGPYSTSVCLAKALDINPEEEFGEYFGVMPAVIGKTDCRTMEEFARKAEMVVGHRVKVWFNGSQEIKGGKVAVQAGGNLPEEITEAAGLGINTFVTGVTRPNKFYLPSLEFHRLAKENKMNIIGATHYSTEKFACMAMVEYFKELGLAAEFIAGEPDLNDLE
jgi:putative NIF3 family GTP cyclohydrolase 1 type 2